MVKIKKIYTKTYDCYEAVKWEETFGETIETRNRVLGENYDKFLEKCFMCDYKFKYNDIPWLGLVKNHKNVFLCETCGKIIHEKTMHLTEEITNE